jgi:hypothetical protein
VACGWTHQCYRLHFIETPCRGNLPWDTRGDHLGDKTFTLKKHLAFHVRV